MHGEKEEEKKEEKKHTHSQHHSTRINQGKKEVEGRETKRKETGGKGNKAKQLQERRRKKKQKNSITASSCSCQKLFPSPPHPRAAPSKRETHFHNFSPIVWARVDLLW